MNDDVKKFIEEHQTQRSTLDSFFDDILELKKANLSFRLIVEYLKTKGVETSIQNVASYYKRRTEKKEKRATQKKEPTAEEPKGKTADDLLGKFNEKKGIFDIPSIQKKGWQD